MKLREYIQQNHNLSPDQADEFALWAFGPSFDTYENIQYIYVWNLNHSDLFIIQSQTNLFEALNQMINFFKTDIWDKKFKIRLMEIQRVHGGLEAELKNINEIIEAIHFTGGHVISIYTGDWFCSGRMIYKEKLSTRNQITWN